MSLKEEKREKAKRLIALALDDPKSEEGDAAAWRALRIIRKYNLLDLTPVDGILENDTVKAVKAVADAVASPEVQGALEVLKHGFRQVRARARSSRR